MAERLTFTVDSHLLEELGERLVGRPATALAELVKNAYDADATIVDITMDTSGEGLIEVSDNGHGMTFQEFRDYWMRLGSQHKREQRVSRNFDRPFTGSKGVGRIAAQLLSKRFELVSVSERDPQVRLHASLDWKKAIETGDLVDVEVLVDTEELDEPAEPGTTLRLMDLRDAWEEEEVEELAQEVWQLQPPFGRAVPREEATAKDFKVLFGGPDEDLVAAFDKQMQAILKLWNAKAVGKNENGEATIALEFKGEETQTYSFNIDDCELQNGTFELRFYDLSGRQPHGIKVGEAREYLEEFGGVHIYDTGFRLPYYGEKDNDWLLISYDTARRKTKSKLIPDGLQVERGLLTLPQWKDVLGMVEINTSEEPGLEPTITRDRLVEAEAFTQLREFVRRAIHWYANEKARRRLAQEATQTETARPSKSIDQVRRILDQHRQEIPNQAADEIESALEDAKEESARQEQQAERRIGALSSFATAGISALGYHHELTKQLVAIEDLAEDLNEVLEDPDRSQQRLGELRAELVKWVGRARQIGKIFSHLGDPENIEDERRYNADGLIREVWNQIDPIRGGADLDIDGLDQDLRLPKGTYTEWVSVIQNVFFNALNAMVDSDDRIIRVRSEISRKKRRLIFEDTGRGVDLEKAEDYFEPFQREMPISQERRELGFGGTGLGLTIIRMIAQERRTAVHFEEPEEPFSTALVFEWEEIE